MTKPDMMAELAEVVAKIDAYRDMDFCLARKNAYTDAASAAAEFLRTHHAELEAVVRDAARYRWLRDADPEKEWDDAYRELGGCSSAEHVDNAIDKAMHNSAREG